MYNKLVSGKRAATRIDDKVPRGTPGKGRTLGQGRPGTRVDGQALVCVAKGAPWLEIRERRSGWSDLRRHSVLVMVMSNEELLKVPCQTGFYTAGSLSPYSRGKRIWLEDANKERALSPTPPFCSRIWKLVWLVAGGAWWSPTLPASTSPSGPSLTAIYGSFLETLLFAALTN